MMQNNELSAIEKIATQLIDDFSVTTECRPCGTFDADIKPLVVRILPLVCCFNHQALRLMTTTYSADIAIVYYDDIRQGVRTFCFASPVQVRHWSQLKASDVVMSIRTNKDNDPQPFVMFNTVALPVSGAVTEQLEGILDTIRESLTEKYTAAWRLR